MPQFWVYALWSPTGKRFYTGITQDLEERLRHHNGRSRAWTHRHRPWKLVWQSPTADRASALALEKKLKAQHGGRGFFALTGLNPSDF